MADEYGWIQIDRHAYSATFSLLDNSCRTFLIYKNTIRLCFILSYSEITFDQWWKMGGA